MKRWNTKEVVDLLQDDKYEMYTEAPGGDVDTSVVIVHPQRL
jgi:hypothetical protein